MHSFTFNGINSREYCELFVSGGGTFNAPERDIESIPIPGRNGELTIDHGRYKNIKIEYPAWIADDFVKNAAKARAWLCGSVGYKRLEDDYNPLEFRRARFLEGLNFDVIASSGDMPSGKTTLVFDCMPQRYLKSGEEIIDLLGRNNMFDPIPNPALGDALPLIELSMTDNSVLPQTPLIVNSKSSYSFIYYPKSGWNVKSIVIDCERHQVFRGTLDDPESSWASYPDCFSGNFPIFAGSYPGTQVYTSGVEGAHIRIIPRWWTI